MRLKLVVFGKLKNPGMRDSADYYLRLIRPWVTVEEVELKPLAVPDKNEATRRQIQLKEAEILLKRLEGIPFYLLDETGKALSTLRWSALARDWEASSPQIALCLGSSLGFSEEVRKRARGALSLGPQTLAHELARVVLLEQLYRAWSVVRGHPYHNQGA